jgi:hypothetical protein
MKKIFAILLSLFCSGITFSQKIDVHYQLIRDYAKTDCRAEIKIPDIFGYKTLKGDFHSHTIFSDGSVTPQERVNEAWREGLDILALTDHNTPFREYIKADYNTAFDLAKGTALRKGIILVKGIEYTGSKPVGHLNFLFIGDANPYSDSSKTAKETIELAANSGAFVVYNHPGWPDMNSDLFDLQIDLLAKKKIHAMEVINGYEIYPIVTDYCNKYSIAPLSSTDIHDPIQSIYDVDRMPRNFTLVFAKEKTLESVKEAMFAGRTVAYANNILVGKPEFLLELLKKSLIVSNFKTENGEFFCDITNTSDICYVLERPNNKIISFPADRTVQLSGSLKSLAEVYQLTNTYISSSRHIELSLNFLLTPDNEVSMPFISENLAMISQETEIELTCNTLGAQVRYTLDGTEPTESSSLYSQAFTLKNSCIILAKAFKAGLKPSFTFRAQALLDIAHPAAKITNVKNGLNYKYFEGPFLSVYDFETKGKLLAEGSVGFPDISLAKREDHFGLVFSGYIFAPSDGIYSFATQSDDGSTLKVSGIELIDNDGSHGLTKVSANIRLKKGYHPIELRFMEDYEGQELNLFWTIPKGKFEIVDARFFFVKK